MKRWIAIGAFVISSVFPTALATAATTGSSTAHHTVVPVVISKTSGNTKLAEAIQKYLQRVSDPTIFKQFTIIKVTYQGKHFGHAEWTVQLNVKHQPHKSSAFNEGMNYRYVTFSQKNGQYIVTGLATGM
jgi:hypothetical protein